MKQNRETKILELLTAESRMEVSVLAETLEVSQVTMRKDLDNLAAKGLVKRAHGYAALCSTDDISGRLAYHYEEKRRIAAKAAGLVNNGETLMIESGSCCALLADTLAETHRDLTIITNSAFIAGYIRSKSRFQTILLGGIYQPDAQVMVGPMVRQCAENFFVKHFFLGVDGYSPRTGFTNRDQLRAQAVRDMARQAEQVVVVTESEKFLQHGIVPLGLTQAGMVTVTDSLISQDMMSHLESQNIRVVIG